MIDVAVLRDVALQIGLSDTQIVKLTALYQSEIKAHEREKARIRKRNQRSRHVVTRDSVTQKEGLHTSKEKLPHSEEPKKVLLRSGGQRLDPTWAPSKDGTDFAVLELGGQQAAFRELETFRDYWTAKSGAGATKVDWEATWRNWVRKSHDDKGQKHGAKRTYDSKPTRSDDILAGFARVFGGGNGAVAGSTTEEVPSGTGEFDFRAARGR